MPRKMNTYVALLRGINVGGNNIIPMADLRACFEENGFQNVSSYIQSGNVIFQSTINSNRKLVSTLEKILSQSFSYDARVVVIESGEYNQMVESAHQGWGDKEDQKHNAMFLVDQTDAMAFLATLPAPKKSIDKVSTGSSVIFWSANQAKVTQSSMMQIAKLKAYKQMTVRNHKTTRKIKELLVKVSDN